MCSCNGSLYSQWYNPLNVRHPPTTEWQTILWMVRIPLSKSTLSLSLLSTGLIFQHFKITISIKQFPCPGVSRPPPPAIALIPIYPSESVHANRTNLGNPIRRIVNPHFTFSSLCNFKLTSLVVIVVRSSCSLQSSPVQWPVPTALPRVNIGLRIWETWNRFRPQKNISETRAHSRAARQK